MSNQPGASEPQSPEKETWGWTRNHRIGLGLLLSLLFIVLIVNYIRRPARLDDRAVLVHGTPVTLPPRVNPNTATREELARIPQLGEARAQKVIDYREARKSTAAGGIVFRNPADLDNVPDIGKKLIEQFEPFMEFPDTPSTQP